MLLSIAFFFLWFLGIWTHVLMQVQQCSASISIIRLSLQLLQVFKNTKNIKKNKNVRISVYVMIEQRGNNQKISTCVCMYARYMCVHV